MKYVAPGHLDSTVSVQPRYSQTKNLLVSYSTKPLGLF